MSWNLLRNLTCQPPNLSVMKLFFTNKSSILIAGLLLVWNTNAQQPDAGKADQMLKQESEKRIDEYQRLSKMGFTDQEIFEDLGNAYFLMENYETAAFWYQKLVDLQDDHMIPAAYMKRYQIAREKTAATINESSQHIQEADQSHALEELRQLVTVDQWDVPADGRLQTPFPDAYKPPITVTADGKTAFFNKAVYMKPEYGLFSEKQKFFKIYKAERINGKWTNIEEVVVCPKYASAVHPTISKDGKRLFYASDMRGSYGKYDIYVSDLMVDGTFSRPYNLGTKVNTKSNDLYPSIGDDGMLVFASDGREGQGGLDLYVVEVEHNRLGLAVNLGDAINSDKDEFGIAKLDSGKMGYVISNRGLTANEVQQFAFSGTEENKSAQREKRYYDNLNLADNSYDGGYSNTVYDE